MVYYDDIQDERAKQFQLYLQLWGIPDQETVCQEAVAELRSKIEAQREEAPTQIDDLDRLRANELGKLRALVATLRASALISGDAL